MSRFDLSRASKVLDLGCRDGVLSHQLASRYPRQQFCAIEPRVDAVVKAKTLPPLANLSFEQHDPTELETKAAYDAVVSFSYLHWIADKRTVFKQIYQSLKPGGQAYLQFFARHGQLKNDRFLYQVAASPDWKSYFRCFTPDYSEMGMGLLATLLQQVGFTVQRLEFVRHRVMFEHAEELQSWLATWASHVYRLPLSKQKRFLAEVVTHYLRAHALSPQNRFPYSEYLLQVVCKKPTDPEASSQFCFSSDIYFTPRERVILKYYLRGYAAKEVASRLHCSAKTVEFHLAGIRHKTGARKRSELFQLAWQQGFVELAFE